MNELRTLSSIHWNTTTFLAIVCVGSLCSKQVTNDLTRNTVCWNKEQLNSQRKNICQRSPELMKQVDDGITNGILECQRQFAMRKWNCSTTHKTYKRTLKTGTREAAYLNAIMSAGILHSVTLACSKGLLAQCYCQRGRGAKYDGRSQTAEDDWYREGCSDDVQFGYSKSKRFMDKKKSKSDVKALINQHNTEAGRQVILQTMRKNCKCHGMSGSCTVRTCWNAMATFEYIGRYLRDKYDGAPKVISSNDGGTLIPEDKIIKYPTDTDLVYTNDSPTFCEQDKHFGVPGTSNRFCNVTSYNEDSCDLLCCNRGFLSKKIIVREKCDCKFIWCCNVRCEICSREINVGVCL